MNIKNQPRVVSILVTALGGFVLGQVLASLLDAIFASTAHYPGGMTALSRAAEPPWWSNVAGLVGLWIGFGVAIYAVRRRGDLEPWANAWRPRVSDALFVVAGVGLQVVVGLAYLPFHFKNMNSPVNHLFGSSHGGTFVLVAFMTVIGAPLVEEWLFRGVVFRGLNKGLSARYGPQGTFGAVVLSALIFAAAHAEWLQFPGLFFLGVMLALIVLRTKRLLPAVLTHVGFNALTMASLVSQRLHH